MDTATKQTLFPSRVVSHLLALPTSTLNSWGPAGVLDALAIPPTTSGKAREYTLNDVFRLSFVREAARVLDPLAAAGWVGTVLMGIDFDDADDVVCVSKDDLVWAVIGAQDGREYEWFGHSGQEIPGTPILHLRLHTKTIVNKLSDKIISLRERITTMNRKEIREWMEEN